MTLQLHMICSERGTPRGWVEFDEKIVKKKGTNVSPLDDALSAKRSPWNKHRVKQRQIIVNKVIFRIEE
jgi:hypothetical protein